MIVVLADDLTGAAEIGGIAWRYGLSTEIQTEFQPATDADLIVVDTDTRACTPLGAAQRVAALAEQCRRAGITRLFKKVDSVLRGPVLAELAALLAALGRSRALLAPANPSLGRTIQAGNYWVNGALLHHTDFANDPGYPAATSNVKAMLEQRSGSDVAAQWPVVMLSPGQVLPPAGICVGESAGGEDVAHWAAMLDEATIPAGAAEYFAAFLEASGYIARQDAPAIPAAASGNLFVSGSTARASRMFYQQCEATGVPVLRLPAALLELPPQTDLLLTEWAQAAVQALQNHPQAVIAIDRPVRNLPDLPHRLTEYLSTVTEQILADYQVKHLWVEGGATAAALIRRLNWQQFRLQQELRPGVVSLQVGGAVYPILTMKPGSYTWPADVLNS